MTRIWTIAFLLVVMAGCPKSGGGGGGGGTGPTPGAGFDERQVCTVDADCAAVEIECCDHCNGGVAVGVHRDSAEEVRAQYAGDRCAGTACTRMGCEPAIPICRQERCGVSIAGEEKLTPLPRP